MAYKVCHIGHFLNGLQIKIINTVGINLVEMDHKLSQKRCVCKADSKGAVVYMPAIYTACFLCAIIVTTETQQHAAPPELLHQEKQSQNSLLLSAVQRLWNAGMSQSRCKPCQFSLLQGHAAGCGHWTPWPVWVSLETPLCAAPALETAPWCRPEWSMDEFGQNWPLPLVFFNEL